MDGIVAGVLLQDGSFSAGAWTDHVLVASESLGARVGLRFSGFPAICTLRSGTLTISTTPTAGQVPCTVNVYARGGQVSAAWSTGAPPRAETALDPLGDFFVGSFALAAAGLQVVPVTLDVVALNTARGIGFQPETSWDGLFSLHLHTRTADETALSFTDESAALAIDLTTRVFTGIEVPGGGPLKVMSSRPDICPICGDEVFREFWVWCGFHERLECPRCADPGLGEEPNRTESNFELVGED